MGRILQTYVAATLIAAAATLMPAASMAADEPGRQFSAKAGEPVSAALGLMNEGRYAEALGHLRAALTIEGLTPYEQATIMQMQGSAYYELEKISQAISAFEAAIKTGGLNTDENRALNLQIAQLMIVGGQPARGAQKLEDWAESGGDVKPAQIELLVKAWIEAQRYDRALPWAKKWYEAAAPKERKHFDLMNFLYSELKQPDRQTEIVTDMLERWPADKALWTNLASLLSNSGHEIAAFDVNREMYLRGLFETEPEILKLVQYYGYHGIPYHGAKVMAAELLTGRITTTPQNLTTLSDLWRQAREYERAIPVLREAAALTDDSALYVKLGEALFHGHKCDEAEAAFKAAIDKGHDPGKAWMLIGTCRYEQAQEYPHPECEWPAEKQAAALRVTYKLKALAAFSNVPVRSSQVRDAKKWSAFIRAESEAFEARCEFVKKLLKDDCYGQIDRAYDAFFLTKTFALDDPACMEFKPDYDKDFRKPLTDTL